MIDYTLRECPFCGNPAEVIYAEPYDWNPGSPTKKIRCSNKYCIGYTIENRYQAVLYSCENRAREDWNTRRRKNKMTWKRGQEDA